MFRKRILSLLALLTCLAGAFPCTAAEVDCDTTYCFTAGDFSGEEALSGICITGLPAPETGGFVNERQKEGHWPSLCLFSIIR